ITGIDAEFDSFGRHNDLHFQLLRSQRPRNWASSLGMRFELAGLILRDADCAESSGKGKLTGAYAACFLAVGRSVRTPMMSLSFMISSSWPSSLTSLPD